MTGIDGRPVGIDARISFNQFTFLFLRQDSPTAFSSYYEAAIC
jgi:hypothetical protein